MRDDGSGIAEPDEMDDGDSARKYNIGYWPSQ